jgi:hypothetical protein
VQSTPIGASGLEYTLRRYAVQRVPQLKHPITVAVETLIEFRSGVKV